MESGEFMPVGSQTARRVDVRFLAATHRDLGVEVRAGRFRSDLYCRRAAATVHLPPLRERPRDLLALTEMFVQRVAHELQRTPPALTADALQVLLSHPWPGNIRELRNVIERSDLLTSGEQVEARTVLSSLPGGEPAEAPVQSKQGEDPLARARILAVLQEHGGNQTRAARALSMSRMTLAKHMDRLGISRPRRSR
jgi:DNA-binding NtrC family response regulator